MWWMVCEKYGSSKADTWLFKESDFSGWNPRLVWRDTNRNIIFSFQYVAVFKLFSQQLNGIWKMSTISDGTSRKFYEGSIIKFDWNAVWIENSKFVWSGEFYTSRAKH